MSYGGSDNPTSTTSNLSSTTTTTHRALLKPDWLFQSDVRGRYEKSQNTARKVLQRLNTSRTSGGSARSSRLNTAGRRSQGTARSGTAGTGEFSSPDSDSEFEKEFLLEDSEEDTAVTSSKEHSKKGDTFLTDLDHDMLGGLSNLDFGQPRLSTRSQSLEQPQLKNLTARSRTSSTKPMPPTYANTNYPGSKTQTPRTRQRL